MLEAPHHYSSLHSIWDHTELPATRQMQHSHPYPVRCYSRYSIYPLIKDERLSKPEPTQVDDLPIVATEVTVVPGVSWLRFGPTAR